MKHRFAVTILQKTSYLIEVAAKDEDAAEKKALTIWHKSPARLQVTRFEGASYDAEVTHVVRGPPQQEKQP